MSIIGAKTQFEAVGPAAAAGATETIVMVDRGMGVSSIGGRLENLGLISNARFFSVGVRLAGEQNNLKAGEYAIPSGASMQDIMAIMRDGQSLKHWITIPEGLANIQIAEIIAANEILEGEMPGLPGEGEILPETYDFLRGTTRAEFVARMQAAMTDTLDELWEARAEETPLTSSYEALILASIVQKETGLNEETPLVASVFINRLNIGYRLQSDPTIIYGLTQGVPLGRPIRQSELDRVTGYNTYHIDPLTTDAHCRAGSRCHCGSAQSTGHGLSLFCGRRNWRSCLCHQRGRAQSQRGGLPPLSTRKWAQVSFRFPVSQQFEAVRRLIEVLFDQ